MDKTISKGGYFFCHPNPIQYDNYSCFPASSPADLVKPLKLAIAFCRSINVALAKGQRAVIGRT